jgi:zinc protease
MSLRFGAVATVLVLFFLAACEPMAPPSAKAPLPFAPPPKPAPTAVASPDVLGERPVPERPPAYVPPAPVVVTTKSGLTVWLLERHTLPIVSVSVVVPGGASVDPPGKEGLASLVANLLDEGAGGKGALELARTFEALGAQVKTGAVADYSFAQLTVLRRNLGAALVPFSDVVARPSFTAADFHPRERALDERPPREEKRSGRGGAGGWLAGSVRRRSPLRAPDGRHPARRGGHRLE